MHAWLTVQPMRCACLTPSPRDTLPVSQAAVRVLPVLPADVVTMNSRIEIREGDEAQTRALVLSYPAEADPQAGRISVLSPVGASLLGLRCGETASWRTPQGELRSATVTAILYQPEAAGHYTV